MSLFSGFESHLDLDEIHSDGYSFQIEMTFKAWKKNFRILELPIVFTDRIKGNSKMTRKIMREAAWIVWKLRFFEPGGENQLIGVQVGVRALVCK